MELDFTSDTVEKLLFKYMLSDKNWTNTMSNLYDKRWFKVKNLAELVDCTLKYYKKHSEPPTCQVLQMLARKYKELHPDRDFQLQYVNQLISDVYASDAGLNSEVAVANIREFIRKNAFSYMLLDNVDILAESESEKSSERYQQVINMCIENFDKVQRVIFNDIDMGLNYFDPAAMTKHWEFLKNPEAKIQTGWESVDRYTNGGFLKDGRMLGLFMAQAGLGKSVFLSNLAVNFMRQNLSVVVISLEMSEDVYAQRFDAHISCKNINQLYKEEACAKDRINAFYQQYPDANLVIKEFPPRSVNTRAIQIYLENLKAAGHKIDVIIIDYLNLVLPNKQTDSMFKDGMAVSEELRGLSYLMNCPVISAVQSNSEGMNTKEIDMQNVSESRGIVHTADALFALYQTPEQREEGMVGFKVIKNRLGGMVGKHSVFKMDPQSLVLTDVTSGDDSGHVATSGQSSVVADVLSEFADD